MYEATVEAIIIISLLAIGSVIATFYSMTLTTFNKRIDEAKATSVIMGFLNTLGEASREALEISSLSSINASPPINMSFSSAGGALRVCRSDDLLKVSYGDMMITLTLANLSNVLGVNVSNVQLVIPAGKECASSSGFIISAECFPNGTVKLVLVPKA